MKTALKFIFIIIMLLFFKIVYEGIFQVAQNYFVSMLLVNILLPTIFLGTSLTPRNINLANIFKSGRHTIRS